jgi:hypothetical protein
MGKQVSGIREKNGRCIDMSIIPFSSPLGERLGEG